MTLSIIFLVLAGSAIVCCYLNYTFSKELSIKVFYMFAGALAIDLFVFRNLIILLMALIRFIRSKIRGYKYIQY